MRSRTALLLCLFYGIGLCATEPISLIKPRAGTTGSQLCQVNRDLFGFASSPVLSDPERAIGLPPPQPPSSGQPLDVTGTAADTLQPKLEIVFLGAIMRKNRHCALISINGEMEVVMEGDTLENGWQIGPVTLTSLTVNSEQGPSFFSMEGDVNE